MSVCIRRRIEQEAQEEEEESRMYLTVISTKSRAQYTLPSKGSMARLG